MVAQTFRGHGCIEYAETGTPMALGYDEAGKSLGNETRPELSVMAAPRSGDSPAAPHRQAIGKKASQ
jgi:hypothetical protein